MGPQVCVHRLSGQLMDQWPPVFCAVLCVCCSQCCWARIIPSMGFMWILAPAPGAPDLSESSQCHGDVQSLRTEPAAASALSFPQHLCCGTWQQRGKLLGATDAEELCGKAGIQQPLWVTGQGSSCIAQARPEGCRKMLSWACSVCSASESRPKALETVWALSLPLLLRGWGRSLSGLGCDPSAGSRDRPCCDSSVAHGQVWTISCSFPPPPVIQGSIPIPCGL